MDRGAPGRVVARAGCIVYRTEGAFELAKFDCLVREQHNRGIGNSKQDYGPWETLVKKRIGFGKVLFLLLAFPAAHVFAAPADTEGESKPTKQASAVEFKVFDTASLVGDEPSSCINGYLVPCAGTEEACRCDSTVEA